MMVEGDSKNEAFAPHPTNFYPKLRSCLYILCQSIQIIKVAHTRNGRREGHLYTTILIVSRMQIVHDTPELPMLFPDEDSAVSATMGAVWLSTIPAFIKERQMKDNRRNPNMKSWSALPYSSPFSSYSTYQSWMMVHAIQFAHQRCPLIYAWRLVREGPRLR